ncbi:MAG: NERD domain-containing protein, partial [Candidatus Avispirillum sp.]
KYLESYGIRVWVDGYAFLLHANSPVENECILSNKNEIDKAIHTPGRKRLDSHTVETIVKLLS